MALGACLQMCKQVQGQVPGKGAVLWSDDIFSVPRLLCVHAQEASVRLYK